MALGKGNSALGSPYPHWPSKRFRLKALTKLGNRWLHLSKVS